MFRYCPACNTEKAVEDFYSSPTTPCRECWKARVRANRAAKVGQYRDADRQRASRPERVAARAAYAQTEKGRAASASAKRAYAARNRDKRAAHVELGNALRDGRITRRPCVVCASLETEGHHFDYSRPLDVVWLCPHHHAAFHKVEREINRKKETA